MEKVKNKVNYILNSEIASFVLAKQISAVCVTPKGVKLSIYQFRISEHVCATASSCLTAQRSGLIEQAEGHMFTRLLESCR